MKRKLCIFFLSTLFGNKNSFAQHTEFQLLSGAGLFHYKYIPDETGIKEPFYSMLDYNPNALNGYNTIYVNNPRGDKAVYSWHLQAGIKRVTHYNMLFGFNFFYEKRESEKNINWTFDYPVATPATGRSSLTNHLIGLSSNLGKRFPFRNKDYYLDLILGADIMKSVADAEHIIDAVITSTGETIHAHLFSSSINGSGRDALDFTLNWQIQFGYKHIGVSLGYASGYYNYEGAKHHLFGIGDIPSSTSRYLYGGLFYIFKKRPVGK